MFPNQNENENLSKKFQVATNQRGFGDFCQNVDDTCFEFDERVSPF